MHPNDLTQAELDALLAALHAAWATLPTDDAGVCWLGSAQRGPRLASPTAQEGLGLDARGRVHWYWWQGEDGFAPTYKGSGWFPATPDARLLCRLPETWGRFVARLRRWRDTRGAG